MYKIVAFKEKETEAFGFSDNFIRLGAVVMAPILAYLIYCVFFSGDNGSGSDNTSFINRLIKFVDDFGNALGDWAQKHCGKDGRGCATVAGP